MHKIPLELHIGLFMKVYGSGHKIKNSSKTDTKALFFFFRMAPEYITFNEEQHMVWKLFFFFFFLTFFLLLLLLL